MEEQCRVLAIERWVEECSKKSQEMVDWLDPRVYCPQWLVHTWELARLNGFATQRIEAIDIGKVENRVEHERAQREEYVFHGES